MALDARDHARLMRIEMGLAESDPALARMFRRWRPSSAPSVPGLPGWTQVSRRMLVAFGCGLAILMTGPVVGGGVVAICATAVMLTLLQRRQTRRRTGRDDDDGRGDGGARRPTSGV
jgi:hypothetical protein